MAEQATLVIIKPDAIQKALTGTVIARLDQLRLEIIAAKMVQVSRKQAEEHYKHIRAKAFFEDTVLHLMGTLHNIKAVLMLIYWGEDAVERVRRVAGATNPEKADAWSVRGGMGRNIASGLMENVLHASSDAMEAEREIRLWFRPQELLRQPFMNWN